MVVAVRTCHIYINKEIEEKNPLLRGVVIVVDVVLVNNKKEKKRR